MIGIIPYWVLRFRDSYSKTWNDYTRSRARHALKLIRLLNKYKMISVENSDPMNLSARVMVTYFHKRRYVIYIKRSQDRTALNYQIIKVVYLDEINP